MLVLAKKISASIGPLMCVMLILSACGGNSISNTPSSSNTTAPSTAASETPSDNGAQADEPATKTVKTIKGDIELPLNPKRVIAGYYHGTLLALGIQPIGGSKEWWMGSPFLKEQEAAITDIGSPASPEKVLEMEPDLIVINDTLADNYDKFAQIAPTLFIEYGSTKNVREEVKQMGALLNKSKEADAWLAEYENKAEKARNQLKDVVKPGATAVLLEVDGKTLAVLGDNYGRGGEVIYNALKFKAPDWVQENVIDNGAQYVEISEEKLAELANTDYIFLSTYTETTEEQFKELTDGQIWKSLPAVKNGNLIPVDYKTYFYFDPISIVGQIDTLKQTLIDHKPGE
ncbi:iron complex transport system substrate-binding protein [Paenibacillus algorifonticola]|uniref:Iron complex transport system substrate-binding protein n=1 Tax=Paenibacillus algorifonticola TaxID=684063 RepID=A0A1I2G5J4_9BACL|nr:ABC transporter substrate-binding protein [Paenibacillus algorifonticola]SFF12393.1 iron complex transport system substrate-binding protein [Paenibacillus algorifonticola]